jgi:hemerythrin-like domain-containing protein
MHVSGMSVQPPATLDGFEVLDATHRQTLAALERLEALAAQLRGGAGADAQARAVAAEIVQYFSNTARQHHLDEEIHVFPRLAAGAEPETAQALQRLRQDHGWLEEDWLELSPLLDAVAGGQSWVDTETLLRGVEIFVALSRDHMALEESVIYPQAQAHVPARERRAMGREMAARRRSERQGR